MQINNTYTTSAAWRTWPLAAVEKFSSERSSTRGRTRLPAGNTISIHSPSNTLLPLPSFSSLLSSFQANSHHRMSNGQVQTFGKKKTATAVATCVSGKGLIRVNGSPIQLTQPDILRYKVYEPVLVVGESKFAPVDIRVRVSGGGVTSQIYAIRQAIAKALVAFYAKNFDAASALDLKKTLVSYDRTLLIADPRRCEPKKFGGVSDDSIKSTTTLTYPLYSQVLVLVPKNHTVKVASFSVAQYIGYLVICTRSNSQPMTFQWVFCCVVVCRLRNNANSANNAIQ